MIEIDHLSLKYDSKSGLSLLDQTALPLKETWVSCKDLNTMTAAIKELKVRGAPMIGLSSNWFLAQMSQEGATLDELYKASQDLERSRPTAVNLIHYMNEFRELLGKLNSSDFVESWALDKWNHDKVASEKMSAYGVTLIKPGFRILTYCNTGSLAAAGEGTALGVIKKSAELFENISAYVSETRPLLQGGRLTSWELVKAKIPFELIADNMAGSLMKKGKVDAVFVGADRIAANGDTANKIGTYSLAVLAHCHGVPFYIVAPQKTIDSNISDGNSIPIEMRDSSEVRGWRDSIWAPECETHNPAFDVTPASLISAWITEWGVVQPKDVLNGEFVKCGQ